MKVTQNLEEVDRKILDIISHYGNLEFMELWDEIGEDDTLKEHIMTEEEALRRFEFLEAQGFVKSVTDDEGITLWALKK